MAVGIDGTVAAIDIAERKQKQILRQVARYIHELKKLAKGVINLYNETDPDIKKAEAQLKKIINGCGYLHERLNEFIEHNQAEVGKFENEQQQQSARDSAQQQAEDQAGQQQQQSGRRKATGAKPKARGRRKKS